MFLSFSLTNYLTFIRFCILIFQLPSFDARFLCKVTGVPRPEVTWYRDNQPLTDSEKYHIKRDGDLAVLFVCDVTPEDAGTYSCHAKNIDGQVQCDGSLEIVDKM